jgi:hypothetical protein
MATYKKVSDLDTAVGIATGATLLVAQGGASEQLPLATFGVIEDAGETADGHYVRFSSGQQWCWHTTTENIAITTASGYGGHFGASSALDFPKPFKTGSTPVVTPWVNQAVSITTAAVSATQTTLALRAINSLVAADRTFGYHAVGYWK